MTISKTIKEEKEVLEMSAAHALATYRNVNVRKAGRTTERNNVLRVFASKAAEAVRDFFADPMFRKGEDAV